MSPFYDAKRIHFPKFDKKKEVQPLGRTLLSVCESILCLSIKIVNITLSGLYSHDESRGQIIVGLFAFFMLYSFLQDIHYFHFSSPLNNIIRNYFHNVQGFSRTKLNICIPKKNTFIGVKNVSKRVFS